MSLPKPQPGLVLRYDYLWLQSSKAGREDGDKERPATIVVSVQTDDAATARIIVLPITHSEPDPQTTALEIPSDVCRKAGLDSSRSWVVLSEFNVFNWPGFDVAIIPRTDPPTIAYGHLTSGFLAKLQRAFLDLDSAGLTKAVVRD